MLRKAVQQAAAGYHFLMGTGMIPIARVISIPHFLFNSGLVDPRLRATFSPAQPRRAETRSCPKRAHSYCARSASRRTTGLPCLIFQRPKLVRLVRGAAPHRLLPRRPSRPRLPQNHRWREIHRRRASRKFRLPPVTLPRSATELARTHRVP